jgi:hypothetical protein
MLTNWPQQLSIIIRMLPNMLTYLIGSLLEIEHKTTINEYDDRDEDEVYPF